MLSLRGYPRTRVGVYVPGLIADLKEWLADDDGDGPTDLGHSGMRIQEGMQTLSSDGKLITSSCSVCTPRPMSTAVSAAASTILPNFAYAAFEIDHWWTIAIGPISAHRTELIYSWFVCEDAVGGRRLRHGAILRGRPHDPE